MGSMEQILEQVPSESHLVQFCAGDDPALIGNLCIYLHQALKRGDDLIVVTTRRRKDALLGGLGGTARNAIAHGRLSICDSHETLARFMVNGQPDENRFEYSVGVMVREV